MEESNCPSYSDCKLVKTDRIVKDFDDKNNYISDYCLNDQEHWSKCKRYLTKTQLNFCPDFVLPDTSLTPDEIIEKFDTEIF